MSHISSEIHGTYVNPYGPSVCTYSFLVDSDLLRWLLNGEGNGGSFRPDFSRRQGSGQINLDIEYLLPGGVWGWIWMGCRASI